MELAQAATYFALARERERIRLRREAGEPPPWTDDQIFRRWRFCNVRREDDRTTRWFRERVRSHLTGLAVVEATVAFRWFNRIETGELLLDLLLHGWDRREAARRLAGRGGAVVTSAYTIRTPAGCGKAEGVLSLIDVARRALPAMVPRWGASLRAAWADLVTLPYMGGFMAYEVVSDLRWTPVLAGADDVLTWAHAGPGCRRGLGWVAGGRPDYFAPGARGQADMLVMMRDLLALSRDELRWPAAWGAWELREVEHWACETWKYVRARDGGPHPRRRFWPVREEQVAGG